MRNAVVLGCSALTALTIASSPVSATAMKPGLWSLGGVQEVCLLSNGSWYYTTYSGLPGGWTATGDTDVQTILYGGTFFSGSGEDSITVNGKKVAFWTEFGNSGNTLYNYHDRLQITHVSKSCGARRKGGHRETLPPMLAQKH